MPSVKMFVDEVTSRLYLYSQGSHPGLMGDELPKPRVIWPGCRPMGSTKGETLPRCQVAVTRTRVEHGPHGLWKG